MKTSVTHILYSGFGGTTDYVFNLIRGDKKNEFEHSIIFYGVEQTSDDHLQFAKTISHSAHVVIKKSGRDKKALLELKSILKKINPAAITLHVNSLIIDKNKWMPEQCRLVFVEHQAHHLKSKKEWVYSGLAQYRSAHVVSLTEEAKQKLRKKLGWLFRAAKNGVIQTGILPDDFRSDAEKKIFKIGMIGRINSFRDHETLIQAFSELKNQEVELHIAGDGPLLESLMVKYSSDKIIFYGLLSSVQIIDFLAGLSLYVHASLGETSSVAIRQAQASSLPIIASDVLGIQTILADSAILVPPKNISSLRDEIDSVLKNKNLRMELIEKSKRAAEHSPTGFDLFDAYKKLIE